jgi:ABC-type antimicrobial peptide transport system permease subunit
VLRDLDPALPIAAVRTLEDVVEGSVARGRLTFLLLAAFAGTALLLAAIGLYGVIAYTVTQRTREIGIRLALGASPRRVLRQVLGQGLKLVVLGLILGALGAAGLTRLLASLLYQVSPADPLVFGGMALLLLAVALAAAWLPARRAAKVDPMVALRVE